MNSNSVTNDKEHIAQAAKEWGVTELAVSLAIRIEALGYPEDVMSYICSLEKRDVGRAE